MHLLSATRCPALFPHLPRERFYLVGAWVLNAAGHEFENPPVIDPGGLSDARPAPPRLVQPFKDLLFFGHDVPILGFHS